MQALRSEILPPSGFHFATTLKLLPYTVCRTRSQYADPSEQTSLYNLVVARSNFLKIYEVIEEDLPLNHTHGKSYRDGKEADAVEGEVEMDSQGEGFVNMGTVKVLSIHISGMFYTYQSTFFVISTEIGGITVCNRIANPN